MITQYKARSDSLLQTASWALIGWAVEILCSYWLLLSAQCSCATFFFNSKDILCTLYRKVVQHPSTSLNCLGMYGKACFKASLGLYETRWFSYGGEPRGARRAVRAARGTNKSSIRDNVKVTKKIFLANPSETSPEGRTYHQLSRG